MRQSPRPPLEAFFTLHHDYRKKNQNRLSDNDAYEPSYISTLHAPIYRNFYMYVREKKSSHTSMSIPIVSAAVQGTDPLAHRLSRVAQH